MDLGLSYLVLQSGRKHRFSFVFQILPRRKGKVFSRPSRVFPNAFSVHLNLLLTSRSWGVQGKGSISFFCSLQIIIPLISLRRPFITLDGCSATSSLRTQRVEEELDWLVGQVLFITHFFIFFPPSRFLSVKKKLFPLYSEEKLG